MSTDRGRSRVRGAGVRGVAGALMLGLLLAALGVPPARAAAELAGVGLAAFLLHRARRDVLRRAAPAVPALAVLLRAGLYAWSPVPLSPRLSLGVCVLGAAAAASVLAAPARRHRAARLALGIAVAGLSAFLATLAGEVIARHYLPDPHTVAPLPGSETSRLYVEDPELGRRFAARFRGRFVHPEYGGEVLATDSLGFRCPDRPAGSSEECERRLVLFGDSMAVGLGVEWEESLAAHLEASLTGGGGRWCVVNASVPGYSSLHHEIFFPRVAAAARPSLVVAVLYDGNDLEEARELFHRRRRADPGERETEDRTRKGALDVPDLLAARDARWAPTLFDRSYWLRSSKLYAWVDVAVTSRLGVAPPHPPINGFLLRSLRREPDPEVLEAEEIVLAALRRLRTHCEGIGATLVVVRLPTKLQTEPDSLARVLAECGEDGSAYDRARPGGPLLDTLAEEGLPALDLLPELETDASSNPAYFFEGHLSREGNRRIAAAISSFLVERGIVDRAGERTSPARRGGEGAAR